MLFYDWSWSRRLGENTPSVEEYFEQAITPGSNLEFIREGSMDDEEGFQYYVLNQLVWFGGMAAALDKIAETKDTAGYALASFKVAKTLKVFHGAAILATTPALWGAMGLGYVLGAGLGTAVAQNVWGDTGADHARDFYTGHGNYSDYFDIAGNYRTIRSHYLD